MKLLVTGAAGFLGSNVVRLAAERGHEVHALVRDPKASVLEQAFKIHVGDLADRDALRRAAEGIEGVIHCAARTAEVRTDLAKSRETNVRGTANLLAAIQGREHVSWIQISTMSAHEGSTSVYGRTKFEADELVRASDTDWTILRPSLIYGPGKGLFRRTIDVMKQLPVIPIVGSGRELMRPVYVTDVAQAALACLENPATIGRSYMIGGADEVDLNEFFERVARAHGLRKRLVHIPIPVAMAIARVTGLLMQKPPINVDNVLGVVQSKTVDNGPARDDFGFQPMGLDEGLRLTVGG